MAEGFLRAVAGDALDVQSAGSIPAGHVHPVAIRVMAEAGVDISDHRSKHLDEFLSRTVDTVITVCGNADQACPVFPAMVKRHHWEFPDPAKVVGSEEEVLREFRRVRDAIRRVFTDYGRSRTLEFAAHPDRACVTPSAADSSRATPLPTAPY